MWNSLLHPIPTFEHLKIIWNSSDIFWDVNRVEYTPIRGLANWNNIQGHPDIIWHIKWAYISDSDFWGFKNYLEWFGHCLECQSGWIASDSGFSQLKYYSGPSRHYLACKTVYCIRFGQSSDLASNSWPIWMAISAATDLTTQLWTSRCSIYHGGLGRILQLVFLRISLEQRWPSDTSGFRLEPFRPNSFPTLRWWNGCSQWWAICTT